MNVEMLTTTPLTPSSSLGPYRRRDYEALPDEPRCELIYGRFYVWPSPLVLHQVLVTILWSRLNAVRSPAPDASTAASHEHGA